MAEAMYRAIADDLRHKIESGELAPTERLPTELELMDTYEASRNTVRDAVKLLITRGLVETRPGHGTFVVQKILPFVTTLSGGPETGGSSEIELYISAIESQGRYPEVTEPRVEIQRASGHLPERLGVKEGDPVISRQHHLSIDTVPHAVQTSFYPMKFVNLGALRLIEARNLDTGAIAYLNEAIGVRQVGWRDLIRIRAPDVIETDFFGLPADGQVLVFEIQRTGFDDEGNPIRLTYSVYPIDRSEFMYQEGSIRGQLSPEKLNPQH